MEKIVVDYRDILAEGLAVPGRIALYDADGNILWNDKFGLPYGGWCRFYIAEQYLEHAVMLISTMDSELKVYK